MAQFEVLALDKTNSRARAPGSGDSYLMPRSLAVGGETVTASAPVLDLSQSWNAGAVTFTGIKFNVASDVSASGSLLMDLQVGGTSKFSVNKAGNVNLSGSFTFANQNRNTISTSGSTSRSLTINFTGSANIYSGDINSGNQEYLFFGASVQTGTYDSNGVVSVNCSTGAIRLGASAIKTYLVPELADTLAQRNGVNPQTFRLYNTYTDASNYERGFLAWNTNVLEVGVESGGSGVAREARLKGSTTSITTGPNTVTIGGTYTAAVIRGDGNISNFNYGVGSTASWGGYQTILSDGLSISPECGVLWSGTSRSATGAKDVGIMRTAAGTLKVTQGATGTGKLIFIVPTTDPAIAGALWNNAGTLAISAG